MTSEGARISRDGIRAAYELVLGRTPSDSEVVDYLDSGIGSNWKLFLEILLSSEFRTSARVQEFLEVIQSVVGDDVEGSLDFLHHNTLPNSFFIIRRMANSAEEFIFGLYVFILRRLPDPFGFCLHVRLLHAGRKSKRELLEHFLSEGVCPDWISARRQEILEFYDQSGFVPVLHSSEFEDATVY
jgi:hypothetical protein